MLKLIKYLAHSFLDCVLEHLLVVVVKNVVSTNTDTPSGPVEDGTVFISQVVVTHEREMSTVATEVEEKRTKFGILAAVCLPGLQLLCQFINVFVKEYLGLEVMGLFKCCSDCINRLFCSRKCLQLRFVVSVRYNEGILILGIWKAY